MRRYGQQRRELSVEAINVTPMIDVVMCLIIFFLLVGAMASGRGAPIRLPESNIGATEENTKILIVTVASTGAAGGDAWLGGVARAEIDGVGVPDADALERAVTNRIAVQPSLSVQVRADRELPFGAIEPVLRACGRAGATSVRLATERRQ